MKSVQRRAVAIVAAVLAAVAAIAFAAPAFAAPTDPSPNITNDKNAKGSVAFYSSSGSLVTSGTNLKHLFDYALTSSAGRAGTTKATLYFAFPDHTQTDSNNWYTFQSSRGTVFPNPNAPKPPNPSSNPLVTLGSADANLKDAASTAVLDHTSGYDGIVQVRVYDTGPGISQDSVFWATDIYYDASAGTWVQVYPKVSAPAATTTTLTVSPASPQAQGTTETLTAKVSPTTAVGSVDFFDGTTDLGSVAVSGGQAVKTVTLAPGSHSLTAKFVPTDSTKFGGSTSAAVAYTVNGAAATTTTLTATPTGHQSSGGTVTLNAAVSPAAATGAVDFKDGSTDLGSVPVVSGAASKTVMPADGSHSYTAVFTSSDTTKYLGSTSNTVTYTVGNQTVPGAPTGVKASPGTGFAVVSWTKPASDGGSAITGYDVEYSSDGGMTYTSASTAFHTSTNTAQKVTGLKNQISYIFRVAAINALGTGPYSDPSAAVVTTSPDDTGLTISPSTTVDSGKSTTIFGRLTDATTSGTPIAGAAVTLYYRASVNDPFVAGPSVRSSSTGVVQVSVTPPAKRYYLWRFGGDGTYAAVASASDTVSVQETITIAATPRSVVHGHTLKVWGVVEPRVAGTSVTLQHLFNGKAYNNATVTTKSQTMPNGRVAIGYIFTVTLAKSGSYTYRTYQPGSSSLLAAKSDSITVTAS